MTTAPAPSRGAFWLAAAFLAAMILPALHGCGKQPADEPAKSPAGGENAADLAKHISTSQNNLKQLTLAVHTYHDKYKQLPPAAACDKKTGRPLLSWRVLLLPFLEQGALFKEFKLDEPWDGPNNKKLLEKMPAVYAPVGVTTKAPHATFYRVFVAPPGSKVQTAWAAKPSPTALFGANGVGRITFGIPDGTSNTIAVVEAGEAVPWTKPDELVYEAGKPLPPLGGLFKDGFNAALMDGAVVFMTNKLSEEARRAFITANGTIAGGLEDPGLTDLASLREKGLVK